MSKLQTAFDNIYATMDEIDAFRLRALDNMSTTIGELNGQIGKADAYLERSRSRDAAAGSAGAAPELPEGQ